MTDRGVVGSDLAPDDGVLRLRRVHVLESLAEVVAERGLPASNVAAVCTRASIPRETFNRLFVDLDDCFLALVDRTLTRMTDAICEGFERGTSWLQGIVCAMDAMVGFLDAEPAAARACLLGRAAAGPDALESRAAMMERLKLIIDGARKQLPGDSQPPAVMAEATVLSVLGIMRRRVMNDQAPPFAPLLGQLVQTIVAPYLGPVAAVEAAAECEARSAAAQAAAECETRASAQPRERGAAAAPSRADVLEMLCHAGAYRMRSCLLHLAANPGASNATVGAAIGIAHQGQASTLLSRLHQARLLLKRQTRAGLPNSWSLSPFGAEVAEALGGDAPLPSAPARPRAGGELAQA